jgi:hypothetical protein
VVLASIKGLTGIAGLASALPVIRNYDARLGFDQFGFEQLGRKLTGARSRPASTTPAVVFDLYLTRI